MPGESRTEITEDSPDMENGQSFDRRLSALEKWRDTMDEERGKIARELGEVKGLLTGIGTQMNVTNVRLESIEEKLDDRPSRAELKDAERQIDSIRAKAPTREDNENTKRMLESIRSRVGVKISKLEVSGPGNMKFKLLGVSGVTIVLVFFLIVVIFALWMLRK